MTHDSQTLSYLLPDLLQKNAIDLNLYFNWNANTVCFALFCLYSVIQQNWVNTNLLPAFWELVRWKARNLNIHDINL